MKKLNVIILLTGLTLLLNGMIMLAQQVPVNRANADFRANSQSFTKLAYKGQLGNTAGGFNLKPDNNGLLAFDTTLANNLQQALEAIYATYPIGGLSAAVLVPEQGMWLGVTGYSTLEPPDSISPDMIFNLTGADMPIISALILLLTEEGLLSLDDSIGTYLTDLPATISGQITIRQLLYFTSGLWDYVNDNSEAFNDSLLADLDRLWTFDEIINGLVGPPHGQPGTFIASTTNPIIACEVIRKITQSSMSIQLHQRIFEPLALEHTFFMPEDTLVGPVAHPWLGDVDNWYIHSSNAWQSLVSGLASMFSTAEELTLFVNALFSGQLLTSASLEQFQTLTFPYGPGWGFGLFIMSEPLLGKTMWYWVGSWGTGCLSTFCYYPTSGFSYTVLGNTYYNVWNYFYSTVLLFNEYLKTLPVASEAEPGVLYTLSSFIDGLLCKSNTTTLEPGIVGPVLFTEPSKVKVHPVTDDLWGLFYDYTNGWQLVKFNSTTGEAFPRVGISIPAVTTLTGMDFASDGSLFLASSDGELFTIDTATGETTLLVTSPIPIATMAIQPGTDAVWTSARVGENSDPRIFTINMENGDTLGIGNTGLEQQLKDIAFDSESNLFGVMGNMSSRLVHINTETGKGTEVKSYDTTEFVSLAFSAGAVLVGNKEFVSDQPARCWLSQNYPNPFSHSTNINFAISVEDYVSMKIYNVYGQEVASLVDSELGHGSYKVTWNAQSMPGGVYFCRLYTSSYSISRKLLLQR